MNHSSVLVYGKDKTVHECWNFAWGKQHMLIIKDKVYKAKNGDITRNKKKQQLYQ